MHHFWREDVFSIQSIAIGTRILLTANYNEYAVFYKHKGNSVSSERSLLYQPIEREGPSVDSAITTRRVARLPN